MKNNFHLLFTKQNSSWLKYGHFLQMFVFFRKYDMSAWVLYEFHVTQSLSECRYCIYPNITWFVGGGWLPSNHVWSSKHVLSRYFPKNWRVWRWVIFDPALSCTVFHGEVPVYKVPSLEVRLFTSHYNSHENNIKFSCIT